MHENVVKIPDISLELVETWSLNKEFDVTFGDSNYDLVIAIMKLVLVFSFSGNRMTTYA